MKAIPIEHVKKGDFFRRKADSKTVYIKGDYCRVARKYTGSKYEDICAFIEIKKGKLVFVDVD